MGCRHSSLAVIFAVLTIVMCRDFKSVCRAVRNALSLRASPAVGQGPRLFFRYSQLGC